MCKKSKTLLLLVLVILVIGLLSALAPLSDFDQDGNLDSLVTEGFVLTPMLCAITGLFRLWIRLSAASLTVPQPFSTLIVPPPIPTK